MGRRRPPESPRWALVKWPEFGIGCIPLEHLETARARGAIVVALEDADLMTEAPLNLLSNPRREHGYGAIRDDDGA